MKTSKKRNCTGRITKRLNVGRSVDYDEFLCKELKDLEFAAGYLTACLDEGEDVFLLGIRNVAKAQGGMKALSRATKLNRESLYDMLSKDGNPLFSSVTSIVNKLGLELSFKPRKAA